MSSDFTETVKIAWFGKHFGEEPPLTGNKKQGAGTIFFSGCNLHCVFCQNYQISQQGIGRKCDIKDLAKIMLKLQKNGAINIDLVTPTIWWRQIIKAVIFAKKMGLSVPIVWNSNGYEKLSIIKSMKGLVDIYLPDIKYGDNKISLKYSGVKDYTKVALACLKEMKFQVGSLKIKKGLATNGLLTRHLVLPNNLKNSFLALKMIYNLDPSINISLMSQYAPTNKADNFPEINTQLSKTEFSQVVEYCLKLGFKNGWYQKTKSQKIYIPNFNKTSPFN